MPPRFFFATLLVSVLCCGHHPTAIAAVTPLLAGTAKVDITDRAAGPVHDPSYAKALVLRSGESTIALVTLDAVSVGGIGRVGDGFLAAVRAGLAEVPGIKPEHVIVNASHCHGVVRGDCAQLVIKAVHDAAAQLVPVRCGTATGREDRISENRRLRLKDGSQADMRRAYALPADDKIAAVGPIDPTVAVVRLDREADGSALAVLYHFACHPIMNPPGLGSSADYPAAASSIIEGALGQGAMAFFLQGCGGDINPLRYKEPTRPADAEPLGALLGGTVLATARSITPQPHAELRALRTTLELPRAADYDARITRIEAEQARLLAALRPTNLNFKSFLPLLLQHRLWPEQPSHHAQSYLHDKSQGRAQIERLDADNRALIESYLANIETMEQLTRLNTNLALLKKHREETRQAASPTLPAEVCGLRLGDFRLITFPGELTVEIGLGIKAAAGKQSVHVSGYTNGYLFYTPTEKQRLNPGFAQEDCDTLVAPEWLKLFQAKAAELLQGL